MPTFPPPRVDITSKTWPSSADMLLRRWREGGGGAFGESVFFSLSLSPFCAPWVKHRLVGGTSAAASGVLPRRVRSDASAASFECNFSSPALLIDFDLRDSDVGVPPRRLLPSDSCSGCICRHRAGTEKLTWRRPMRGEKSGVVVLVQNSVMNSALRTVGRLDVLSSPV